MCSLGPVFQLYEFDLAVVYFLVPYAMHYLISLIKVINLDTWFDLLVCQLVCLIRLNWANVMNI